MTDKATLHKALLMIQKLKQLLQEKNEPLFEPVAIIGMSCRLPQANNLQEFWELLHHGKQIITPMPEERWELLKGTREFMQREINRPYFGGYLAKPAAFDAYFFGISPREAHHMDPQQRMLLEVTYASFEDAGLTIEALAGSNTGVFTSLYASQYGHLQPLDAASETDALFIPTGSAVNIAANRLSYLFDLHGPSMTIDTACSSSLIAVQIACLNLQAKLCDQAIVNAVNINLLPSVHTLLSNATMLSPTGKCQTFDANANGYVQGEGVCSIILKPLSKALKDNDRIHAVIAGGAINQDGRTNGLTAPNGLQQEQLLRSAYHSAKIDPKRVPYIECHGTGTFLGDPIEVQALGGVLGKMRDPMEPCWLGSVKTNIGHLEPAAGLVSLIKVALALKHEVIPASLHLTTPNPHIPFDNYGFKVAQQNIPFPKYDNIRVAGISGFGFGGANAHLVLRDLTVDEQQTTTNPSSCIGEELFTLSAKNASALQDLVELWCHYLTLHQDISLAQLCYNMHLKRSHYSHRIGIITPSTQDLHQKLLTLRGGLQTSDPAIFINQDGKHAKTSPTIGELEHMDLPTLAKHYINQASINWHVYEKHRSYALLDMPLYPWQHQHYWPEFQNNHVIPTISTYPLRATLISSPLPVRQFEFIIDTTTLPEMIDTFYVVHAGYYLEIIFYAMQALYSSTNCRIHDLKFHSPLVVQPNKKAVIQLILNTQDSPSMSFTLFSQDGTNHWIEHATGHVLLCFEAVAPALRTPAELREPHVLTGNSETFYDRILNMGMPAGNTVRWVDRYWLNHNDIFCELRLPTQTDRCEQFTMHMHPGIIDACIQTLFLLLPLEWATPYVASHMDNISFYGKSDEAKYIYATVKKTDPKGLTVLGDWYLLDKHSHIIAHCENVLMAQLNNRMSIDKIIEIQAQFHLDTNLPYDTCRSQVQTHLIQQFAQIFSMPINDIPIHLSLLELGIDSLMALAVIRMIETSFDIALSLPELMQNISIQDIVDLVLQTKLPLPSSSTPVIETISEGLWIFNRKPQKHARVRLFCFPFGGGGASIYRDWQQFFPDTIEVCPVQLPGRENRMGENAIHDINQLVAFLSVHLKPLFNLPFAFFGHSLGSLIGFELARYLRQHQLPQPVHLFASAYPDPRTPSKGLNHLLDKLMQNNIHLFDLNQPVIHELSKERLALLSNILKENGLVDYADERINQDIINILLPIFINDMHLAKHYLYQHEAPLDLPLTVFLGQQDTWVLPEDLQGWATHSSVRCDFQSFDSGHLFIKEQHIKTKLIEKISHELLKAKMFDYTLTES